MPQDTRGKIRQLSDHIVDMNNGSFLLSERFSRFCREYGIDEIWGGLLTSAEDRPDLYGDGIVRHAFSRLLEHICRERRPEFLRIISGLLALLPETPCNPQDLRIIKQDLLGLGYSPYDAEAYLPGGARWQGG